MLRAVRIVRSRATEFRINPDRIGVMGSSAGGHLAASSGTLFDHASGGTGAPLDSENARPDFLILMYPVITMKDPAAHAGSRTNLLGENPSAQNLELMSLESQVTAKTSPTLLIHTQEDSSVPVENSIVFYQALTRANVPAEMYLFERGSHGMGMRNGLGTASNWHKRAEEWLAARGLLDAEKTASITFEKVAAVVPDGHLPAVSGGTTAATLVENPESKFQNLQCGSDATPQLRN
nr:prolyl oligopeptidase family [uncultured bacterium]